MRLLSIAVRNYRVLRDVKVELAPGLTLIGAPNESGKSTLIEAVHRGLFLKSRVTGKARDALLSLDRADHPEVALSFAAAGRTWHVVKKFAGQSGQCVLTEEGGATWRADEAEARLAEVLGVSSVTGRAVSEQWAHLWVWQGDSGTDPTENANEQKGALLSRLEQADGSLASVMQSPLDARLAAGFQEQHDALFQRNGDVRAQSAPGRADEEWARAREAAAAAQARCDALGRSEAAFLAAQDTIGQAAADDLRVRPQAAEVETALARVAELRFVEARQSLEAEAASLGRDRLLEAEEQISAFADAAEALAASLAPDEQTAERLAEEEARCLERLESAEAERASSVAERSAAQQVHDLAVAHLAVLEKTDEWQRCQERCRMMEALMDDDRRLVLELAALPVVDAAAHKKLSALEKSRDEAAATLRGMAAGLRVVAADEPVQVDGVDLQAGEERVLTTPAEVVIGRGVRLRLTPGGGAGLDTAVRRRGEADESLQSMLAALGVPTVSAAAETLDRRRHLEVERATLRKRLTDMGADEMPVRAAAATESLALAKAALSRHQAAAPPSDDPDPTPGEMAAAQQRVHEAAGALSTAMAREQAAATARTVLDQLMAQVRKRRSELATALASRRAEWERARARHDYLVSAHGEPSIRQAALASAVQSWSQAAEKLAATRAELAALRPELLESDRDRLRRAMEEIDLRRRQAETAQAIARSELARDGGDDPHESLAQALARERSAAESAKRARRDAEAVRMLHHLFAEEQRALAARLTRPLAEKINSYLQCVFGPGAQAVLTFDNQAFGSFALVRSDRLSGSVPFAALSGGAREQAAAALRLAMAEVLAADHDACLPIVFDDAFAYADPDRVQSLQRMLDLAARRGLQVIVLTCTPADYAGLGAQVVALAAG